ncbi:MAG: FUSC family protein [Acidobacteriia bacterium]|nr:FUSC family protein [Terriglobia bacterium]
MRNTVGVVVPLAIGAAMGDARAGLSASIGALNVAVADGEDPYRSRAARMLIATALCGLAVTAGGLAGLHAGALVPLLAAAGFAAGMTGALGTAVSDLANVTLVIFIVYSGQGITAGAAVLAGILAAGGGALQTALSLALWPIHPHRPERQQLAQLYKALAGAARNPPPVTKAPAATKESTSAQEALQSLSSYRSIEAERHFALLSQAERIRLSISLLARILHRLRNASDSSAEILDRSLEKTAGLLESIAESLENNTPLDSGQPTLKDFDAVEAAIGAACHHAANAEIAAFLSDAQHQMQALCGQLRAAIELAAHSTDQGLNAYAQSQSARPWKLRLHSTLAILRANLTWRSSVFRHSVRLGVSIAFGGALERVLLNRRAYWMPMTVALVLRPDFAATFSRGLLRILGTLVGLALTTGILRLVPSSMPVEIVAILVFVYLLRCFGPANYGIMAAAVSAVIVLMFALIRTDPHSVILLRGANTLGGGAIALLAYAAWPTWERIHIREAAARMLEAYRGYFSAIREAYLEPDRDHSTDLDSCRMRSRLARSNLESALDRLAAEPGGEQIHQAIGSFLANSHRLVQAFMALEAGLLQGPRTPVRQAFGIFADDVDKTLRLLSSALRESKLPSEPLPGLRADYARLLDTGDSGVSRYALVNVEADRITNSLNTLSEQVVNRLTGQ